ncbi:hypothetical protein [Glycomyces sp. MUSA5-2]|uniref:hypothetical protein n=1 Tax=Glycomyces sp. MUSA5-2 TaxID=2053002 RepID=UPI0030087344
MNTTITNESDVLAARAAAGDREALAELYIAHQDEVLDLVDERLHRAARIHIEDAAQDVWVAVCERIAIDAPPSFADWLATLADKAAVRYHPLALGPQTAPEPVPAQAPAPAKTAVRNRFASPLRLAAMSLAVSAA